MRRFRQYADRVAYSFMGKDVTLRRPIRSAARLPPTCRAWAGQGRPRGHHDAQRAPVPVVVAAVLRGLCGGQRQPAVHAARAGAPAQGLRRKAIVIIENFATTLQSCIANTPVKHVVLCAMGDQLGFLKGAGQLRGAQRQSWCPSTACPAPCASTTPWPRASARHVQAGGHQARRHRAAAIHRRHHRREQGRRAAAPQRDRQRAAVRGLERAGDEVDCPRASSPPASAPCRCTTSSPSR